jgi:hypothetical protein
MAMAMAIVAIRTRFQTGKLDVPVEGPLQSCDAA